MPRFEQERKNWATSADDLADQCYRDHFDVTDDDIYDLESLVDDVHDREEGYRTHQILDYGGIDRIIDCGVRHVYIAQRFRPEHDYFRDLSLRTDNGVEGRFPELTKWQTAHEHRGFYPSVIAFGLYEDFLQVFTEFYLLDTETILDAIANDTIDSEVNPTGDGTEARYISIDELRRIDAVIESWENVAPE